MRKGCGAMLVAVGMSLGGAGAGAVEYHVAPSGSDGAVGSAEEPWATVQHAANQAGPGDVVRIHSGTYFERVVFPRSGTAEGGFITFKAAAGAQVTIDGSGQEVSGRQGLLEIKDRSYLRVEGLVVRNYQTTRRDQVPVGILVEGACAYLEIVGNEICDIACLATVNGALDGRDAHGLAVFGTAFAPISHLVIRDNELHDLTLGSSEALVLNGNVEDFRILDNRVSDCDNIGIDLIGFEGTAPNEELDQARNGIVAGNQVWRIDTGANPSYGGETSAAGIYVDGGRDIVLEGNTVSLCNIGIEVASEHAGKVTRRIAVRSNLVCHNEMGGLFIGGYNAGSTGDADDCVITNNTFYGNDTDPLGDSYGQIYLQYRVSNCVFKNNILYPLVSKAFGQNPMIVHWNTSGSGNVFDYNLYYGAGTPVWVLNDQDVEGWAAFRAHPWSGPEERFGDPLFRDAPQGDFEPQGADAVGTGDPALLVAGERDLEGDLRVAGNGLERGAVENGRDELGSFLLSVTGRGNEVLLSWPTREGYFYDVCVRTGGEWATFPGSEALPGTGGDLQWKRAGGPATAVLRVQEK